MMTKRHSHLLPSVLAVELSLPVFTIQVCRDWGSNPHLLLSRQTLHLSVNSNDKHIYVEWNNYIFIIATKSQYCTTMNSLNLLLLQPKIQPKTEFYTTAWKNIYMYLGPVTKNLLRRTSTKSWHTLWQAMSKAPWKESWTRFPCGAY